MAEILEQEPVAIAPRLIEKESLHVGGLVDQQLPLTIEEAEELAQGRSFELIDGRMVYKMGDRKHSEAQTVLIAALFNYLENNPVGKVYGEFSVRLWPERNDNFRTPDVAVFLHENLHPEEKYETRAPDLAVEIVSDGDRAMSLFEKARLYLEKGSKAVWIVFPSEKSVVVMTPNARRWESEVLTCPEVLPGFNLAVEKLFS